MGEWSKTVGEKGEKIVEYFFSEILGYGNILKNETISCIKNSKHKNSAAVGDRNTHGVDALISMKSPVEDRVIDVGIISSKYTSKKYPSSPKTKFKEYITELAYTIECYRNSTLSYEINQNYSGVSKTDIHGILVWASNASAQDGNIISKISNTQLDEELIFDKIIVLDNDRLNFYVETIQFAKKEFGKKNVKFIYHSTGVNMITQQSQSYGDFLPISYLFSDLIPLRIEKEGKIEIVIFTKDQFSQESMGRILDFSKSFDHLGSIMSTTLSFPDFNDLEHSPIVAKEVGKFGHFKFQQNLFVKKHNEDFRNY